MTKPLPRRLTFGSGSAVRRSGFTLLEMLLVVIIVALIAGTLIPVITRPFLVDQRIETLKEMRAIVDAIQGRPDLGRWGFVHDNGRLPLNGVNAFGVSGLVSQGSALSPTTGGLNAGGVYYGWNGPYLLSFWPDADKDAWGTPYELILNPLDASQWRMHSYGPDRLANTADDLWLPDAASDSYFFTTGQLTIDIFVQRNGQVEPVPVSAIATVNAGHQPTLIQPTIYLPSQIDGTLVACQGTSPSASCPGSCVFIDAENPPSASPSVNSPPYRLQCKPAAGVPGLPFGIHRLRIPFLDQTLANTALPAAYETNIVIDRSISYARLVVAPNTVSTVASGFTFTTPTLPFPTLTAGSSPSSGVVAAATGSITFADFSTQQPALYLAIRVTGTVRVEDSAAKCAVTLAIGSSLGATPPTPPTVTLQPLSAAISNTQPAFLPFSLDYVYPVPMSTVPNGTTYTLDPSIPSSAGTNFIEPTLTATGSSGTTCKLQEIDGTITKLEAP